MEKFCCSSFMTFPRDLEFVQKRYQYMEHWNGKKKILIRFEQAEKLFTPYSSLYRSIPPSTLAALHITSASGSSPHICDLASHTRASSHRRTFVFSFTLVLSALRTCDPSFTSSCFDNARSCLLFYHLSILPITIFLPNIRTLASNAAPPYLQPFACSV